MKSPLVKLNSLLLVYSYLGAFPASLGPPIVREWWRLLPTTVVGLIYMLYNSSTYHWSKSEHCFAAHSDWKWWIQHSMMGKVY